jgi:hypothetical protein
MKYSVIQKEFSREIYDFLVALGYTHIVSLGVNKDEESSDEVYKSYILKPIKPVDPQKNIEYPGYIVEPIKSNDVLEMVAGDEFIRFLVEIPVKEFQVFLDKNS